MCVIFTFRTSQIGIRNLLCPYVYMSDLFWLLNEWYNWKLVWSEHLTMIMICYFKMFAVSHKFCKFIHGS